MHFLRGLEYTQSPDREMPQLKRLTISTLPQSSCIISPQYSSTSNFPTYKTQSERMGQPGCHRRCQTSRDGRRCRRESPKTLPSMPCERLYPLRQITTFTRTVLLIASLRCFYVMLFYGRLSMCLRLRRDSSSWIALQKTKIYTRVDSSTF